MTPVELIKEEIDSKLDEINEISTKDTNANVVSAYEFLQYHLLKKMNDPENRTDPKYLRRISDIRHLQNADKDICAKISDIFALCVNDNTCLQYLLAKTGTEHSILGGEDKKILVNYTLDKTEKKIEEKAKNNSQTDVFKNYYDAEELKILKESRASTDKSPDPNTEIREGKQAQPKQPQDQILSN